MRQAMLDDLAAFHQENADLQGLGRERLRLRLWAAPARAGLYGYSVRRGQGWPHRA